MSEYSEKLKDPRWQRKRLEAMQADRFTCQICFSKDKTLNVHHKNPDYSKNPWEYETRELITLCENCHHTYHKQEKRMAAIDNFLNRIR